MSMWQRPLFPAMLLLATVGLAQEKGATVTLDAGVGNAHYAVSTSNAEAQRFFDQGLRYLYAFHHEESVRSFRHATELDPGLAMGYWGVALALGPNINLDIDPEREQQAYAAVQSARAHAAGASAKERDLIEALAKRYSSDPKADLPALAQSYSAAMRRVCAKYPDDLDLATLFAESLMDLNPWKFWTHEGKPKPGTVEIVRVLESVLRRDPHHLGANHYYIHAVEASLHPERATSSAAFLERAAPTAGHLVHMPAHIYQRTGNYAGAAAANAAAARTDRDYAKARGRNNLYSMMYYNHNLQFGAASYAMEGRFGQAKAFADELSVNTSAIAPQMAMVESATASSLMVLLRFGRWADVLRASDVTAGPWSRTFRHFARGVAFARMGDLDGARSEQKAFAAGYEGLPQDFGVFQNPQKSVASVAGPLLEGRIAEAAGNRREAIEAYRRAVAAEDALDYDEPSDWFYPVRETLGAALLRDGRYGAAENTFREDLQKNVRNPRSLYGLSVALAKQKKPAQKVRQQFHRAWRGEAIQLEDL